MGKKRITTTTVPPGKIEPEPVANLLLDADNPRFTSGGGAENQDALLKILWDEFAVDEVALSIAANGYFQEEPLYVIPGESAGKAAGKFVVVEGNRRLAAVKILLDDKLRRFVKATELPEISVKRRAQLRSLPVSKYNSRQDLWQFLGFRHINGPQPWDSFSKAKYIAEVHDGLGVELNAIAGSIGDLHSTVVRLYRGFKILEQAEAMAGFDREDRIRKRFHFSHLYTAADQPEFQKYLGIAPTKSLGPNPVPRAKLSELRELMIWLYGSKAQNRAPLIESQNPDLNTLREVISSQDGVNALRAGHSLTRSHEISIGDERRFKDSLSRAKEELITASGTLTTGYSGQDPPYSLAKDVLRLAEAINDQMTSIRGKSAPGRRRG